MKKIAFMIYLLCIANNGQSQNQEIFVSYRENGNNDFYLFQWFLSDRTLFSFRKVKPVQIGTIYKRSPDGELIALTDTVLYAIEYKKAKDRREAERLNEKSRITMRYYASTVLDVVDYDLKDVKYYMTDTVDNMPPWQTLSDTTTMLGYLCQKAFTNYNGTTYYAWFTPDLQIPAGPKNVRGLPGLILSIWSEDKSYSFQAIEIQTPIKQPAPFFKKDGKKISKSAFDAIIEKQNEASRHLLEQYTQ